MTTRTRKPPQASHQAKTGKTDNSVADEISLPSGWKQKLPQLTLEVVAESLQIPMRKARQLCTSGALPYFRIKGTRKILIDEKDFEKFVKEEYIKRVEKRRSA